MVSFCISAAFSKSQSLTTNRQTCVFAEIQRIRSTKIQNDTLNTILHSQALKIELASLFAFDMKSRETRETARIDQKAIIWTPPKDFWAKQPARFPTLGPRETQTQT